jgi:hypothetical protein
MNVFYKTAAFWTMIAAIIVQGLVGYGLKLEAEMLATITATVIAYLVQRGLIEKAYVQAQAAYEQGFTAGVDAAQTAMLEDKE